MSERHGALTRLVDRILGWLPGSPDERPAWSPMLPDPNEPGISTAERDQRLRLITSLQEKQGKGTPR
jgi:hypothetical protein